MPGEPSTNNPTADPPGSSTSCASRRRKTSRVNSNKCLGTRAAGPQGSSCHSKGPRIPALSTGSGSPSRHPQSAAPQTCQHKNFGIHRASRPIRVTNLVFAPNRYMQFLTRTHEEMKATCNSSKHAISGAASACASRFQSLQQSSPTGRSPHRSAGK